MSTTTATERAGGHRLLVPVTMAALTLLFVILVVYQVGRGDPREVTGEPAAAAPTAGDTIPRPTAAKTETASQLVATAEPDELAGIRARLQDYIDFLRWDAERYRTQGPKIYYMREEFREFLASLPPEAVPLLMDLLNAELQDPNGDFVLRRFFMYGLADIGTDLASDGLADYYHTLLALSEDKDSEIAHTIRALGRVDTPHSFEILNDFVGGGAKMDHRFRFVRELGNHSQRADALPVFTDLMVSDTHFKVRNNAAQALKKAGVYQSAVDIEQAIQNEENPYVKQTMMGALGEIGDRNSLKTLEQVALNDRDNYVNRMSAVDAIRRIGGPDAKRILQQVSEKDPHDRVRFDAQRALTHLEEQGS